MNCISKLFLFLVLLISPIFAFDNEINIRGKVVEGLQIDLLTLSENREDIFLFTNSKIGAKITVKTLDCDNKSGLKNIFNNGKQYTLPMTYQLFNKTCFLGTSPLCYENIILGIDISAH